MSGNHTPTPWYLEVTDSTLWIGVEKAAGGKVGDVITSLEYGDDYNPWHNVAAKANAELIVTAVNSYASSQAEIERLTKALTDLLAANDAVQMVLCDGPEVPGFDPMALGRAQVRVTEAEILAREALSGSRE